MTGKYILRVSTLAITECNVFDFVKLELKSDVFWSWITLVVNLCF